MAAREANGGRRWCAAEEGARGEPGVPPRSYPPQLGSRPEAPSVSSTTSISVFEESTCSRASARAAAALPAADRLADRAVLEVVLRVELVELGACAPDPVADERAPRALRDPLDERQLGDAVDHVVEGVVRLHPLDEQRRVARSRRCAPARGARGSARRTAARPHRAPRGRSGVIFGVATSVASASSSARTRNASRSSCARDRADADAPVRLERDEPERRQPPQRLADRRAADVEPLGELLLAQHGAGRDQPADDLVLEHARDVVGLRGEGRHGANSSRLESRTPCFGSENMDNMPLVSDLRAWLGSKHREYWIQEEAQMRRHRPARTRPRTSSACAARCASSTRSRGSVRSGSEGSSPSARGSPRSAR